MDRREVLAIFIVGIIIGSPFFISDIIKFSNIEKEYGQLKTIDNGEYVDLNNYNLDSYDYLGSYDIFDGTNFYILHGSKINWSNPSTGRDFFITQITTTNKLQSVLNVKVTKLGFNAISLFSENNIFQIRDGIFWGIANSYNYTKEDINYVNLIQFSTGQVLTNVTLENPRITNLSSTNNSILEIRREMLNFYGDNIFIHEMIRGRIGNDSIGETYNYLARYNASSFNFIEYIDLPLYINHMKIIGNNIWYNPLLNDLDDSSYFLNFPNAGINFGGYQIANMHDLIFTHDLTPTESLLSNYQSDNYLQSIESEDYSGDWQYSNYYAYNNGYYIQLVYNNLGLLGYKLAGYALFPINDYKFKSYLSQATKVLIIVGLLAIILPMLYESGNYMLKKYRQKA